jgi:hypothetical protein
VRAGTDSNLSSSDPVRGIMTTSVRRRLVLLAGPLVLAVFFFAAAAHAAAPQPGPPLTIRHAPGPIVIDGDLSDAGWQGADSIRTWFETNVGDNVPPQVGNIALLTYDDHYLYAAFIFEDPKPLGVRAPLGDHDNVSSSTDYAGIIVDSRNDGKTAQMFLSNPAGVQYDAISSDVSGEDNSPDWFWDSKGKITDHGWTLEIRVPFSSLRYNSEANPVWGILLYRNYPRDRRYQFFSARLPRDVNCFICNSSKMAGLSSLPHGSHLVVAPFATAAQAGVPIDTLGSPIHNQKADKQAGVDIKWNPLSGLSLDGTVNPDFSQIESDAAQISANERFALFYPEKRPFFLEGVDLFSTPMQAVYTRTITSPNAGGRVTGRFNKTSFTALYTEDAGGGVVILPGPQGSDAALQDFVSDVAITRVRRDFGQSYISLLATGRSIHGGGSNVVVGPDLQWRPNAQNTFTVQYLRSESETPNRPDLAAEWNGQTLRDDASQASYSYGSRTWDAYVQGQDFGPDFRADNGFIPQVGYREIYTETGYTIRPTKHFFNRVRFWAIGFADYDHESGTTLDQRAATGIGANGALNSFIRLELNNDYYRVGSEYLHRFRPRFYVETVPSRTWNFLSLDTYFGDEIDFDNAREGTGATILASAQIRPSQHLELRANGSWRWIDIHQPTVSGRLFTAQVERLRATWSFNARSFVRVIGQYVDTKRDPTLYTFAISARDANFSSSGLLAYKLNWQTVFYLGYGDQRTFSESTDNLEKSGRQAFAKVSYAFQH